MLKNRANANQIYRQPGKDGNWINDDIYKPVFSQALSFLSRLPIFGTPAATITCKL
jgi:hypothetical protein